MSNKYLTNQEWADFFTLLKLQKEITFIGYERMNVVSLNNLEPLRQEVLNKIQKLKELEEWRKTEGIDATSL